MKSPVVPPMRRRRGVLAVAALTAAAAMVDVAIGGPLLSITTLIYGAATLAVLGSRRRQRTQAVLADLPFAVRHDSKRTIEELDEAGRTVVALTFELRDDAVYMFDDWPSGRRDVAALAHVLSTLGAELHATRGVVCARVAWSPAGPLMGSI